MSTAIENLWSQANEALYIMGGDHTNIPAIATQFVQEKGWDWWANPESPFNVGNVTDGGVQNGFTQFATMLDGVKGYAHVLLTTSFDGGQTLVYQNVLDAVRKPNNVQGVLEALHDSPYCDPPYPLTELQAVLEVVMERHNAETQPKPTPPPVQPEQEFVTVGYKFPYNSLWNIAMQEFGDGRLWTHLESLNPGVIATRLQIGQKIRVK